MDEKRAWQIVGIAIIILTAVLLFTLWSLQGHAMRLADTIVDMGGECVTEEGCIHQQSTNYFVIGIFPAILLLVVGVSIIVHAVRAAKNEDGARYDALLDDERAIIDTVLNEEGITQATLKYRVQMSKSKLSQTLSELERRGLITREESGSTKKVYLTSAGKENE